MDGETIRKKWEEANSRKRLKLLHVSRRTFGPSSLIILEIIYHKHYYNLLLHLLQMASHLLFHNFSHIRLQTSIFSLLPHERAIEISSRRIDIISSSKSTFSRSLRSIHSRVVQGHSFGHGYLRVKPSA